MKPPPRGPGHVKQNHIPAKETWHETIIRGPGHVKQNHILAKERHMA
jgi:hypothetical protein